MIRYFHRDISWLSFNGRVLEEAAREGVPPLERLKFLSIYSSNLDEFYRVRVPALMALHRLGGAAESGGMLDDIRRIVEEQQDRFGFLLRERLIPLLAERGVRLLYGQPLPPEIAGPVDRYFFAQVAAFLQPVVVGSHEGFFPENNQLYFAVRLGGAAPRLVVLKIPSDALPRFLAVHGGGQRYMVFLDDILREQLPRVFPGEKVLSCHSFKITRDADLNLQDEYEGDIAEQMERLVSRRDFGIATRFLYDASMGAEDLGALTHALRLEAANQMPGGRYHNLKDLGSMPLQGDGWRYDAWPPAQLPLTDSLFERMRERDFVLHPPYQSYDTVLRFFNEAAMDAGVQAVFVTLYRVASDSRIGHALISAARNGKRVTVFVELKARFDESNNLKWAKKMKAAGIRIIYSIPGLKVHAKVALVVRRRGSRSEYLGLLGTGNFNETTAAFYTDHILFTADHEMLRELELLFLFLGRRKKPEDMREVPDFRSLLVSRFNLQERLLGLIGEQIRAARRGEESEMILKMNNLEEEVLINKLYEASAAGVHIRLIVRGICRLVPGVPGLSEHISVRRIVDRYLEHGRVWLFRRGDRETILMGSADWMSRNMYRRIEVCFPVREPAICEELKTLLCWQLEDDRQAVELDSELGSHPPPPRERPMASQEKIYAYLKAKEKTHGNG